MSEKSVQAMADDLRDAAGGAMYRMGHSIGGSVTLDAATSHAVGNLLERLAQSWDYLPEYVKAGAAQLTRVYEGQPPVDDAASEHWQEGDVVRAADDPVDTRAWSFGNGRWWPVTQATAADDPTWRPGHFREDLPARLTLIVRDGRPVVSEVSR